MDGFSERHKYKFITYILKTMKLRTEHRKIEKIDGEKQKTPRDLCPGDTTVHRREGPTVQLCGDSNVACKWINGEFAQGTKYKEMIGKILKCTHGGGEEQPPRSLTSTTS